MNNIQIMGRLTAAPELKVTQGGVSVVSFSVAVPRKMKKDQTDFFRCTAWRGTAELIEKWFGKGQMIALVGRMENNPYEKDGVKRDSWQVTVDDVYFCGKENAGEKQSAPASYPVEDDCQGDEFSDDELPF